MANSIFFLTAGSACATKSNVIRTKLNLALTSKSLYPYLLFCLFFGLSLQAYGQFPASINLSSLDGINGFALIGIDGGDQSGLSVSGAGDLNGDGIDDIIIGALVADPNGNSSAGESYVVFGSSTGFGPFINLNSLNGSNGFVLNGIGANDSSGNSVSNAGDFNGDGIDDIIIGAFRADPNSVTVGESYVVFGSTAGFGPSLNLSSLDGTNGFALRGIDNGDFSGGSVSNAGDFNGDGIDDIIIGASSADPNGLGGAGESYVVFGSTAGFGPSFNLSSLDGINGFILNGIDMSDSSGRPVSSAGDVNGDGIDDIIIGAEGADPNGVDSAGESYVVFGSTVGFGTSFNLSSLNGMNGFVINGVDVFERSGDAVSSAGDVNGDGIDDIIVGAFSAGSTIFGAPGASYVVFGSTNVFAPSINPSSLNGTNGFIINGIDGGDRLGSSVSCAGDVNGDGIDDFIIGANGAGPNGVSSAGESYVVFGSTAGFGPSFDLSSLNGNNGFTLNGIDRSDLSGDSVSSAGDVNGDGIDDIIIGAKFADPNGNSSAGESYVVFGTFCPDFITETNNQILTTDKSANISITTNGRVLIGQIDYSAGQSINLTEDFEVLTGAVFHAFIAPCN